jgi:hypothetical protein
MAIDEMRFAAVVNPLAVDPPGVSKLFLTTPNADCNRVGPEPL